MSCEVFSVSNVQEIVHKHLRIQDQSSDAKDPIIHFYEDFLHEYDPAERKRMGATPRRFQSSNISSAKSIRS